MFAGFGAKGLAPRVQLHPARDVFPVDQIVEEVGQIRGALVAEIDVVRVFPHVAAQ